MLKRMFEIMAVALLSAVSASAADLSGQWSGTFIDSDSGKASGIYAVLQQDGTKLTGSAGPSKSHQMPITVGKIDENHLTFEVQTGGGTMSFDLTNSGSELQGKMRLSDDGHTANASVVLKRIP
jgi:hypothetical protein